MNLDIRIRIMCDNYTCEERGKYSRCRLHVYMNCLAYKAWEKAVPSNLEHMSEDTFNKIKKLL